MDAIRYVSSRKSVDSTSKFSRLPSFATPLNYNIVLKPDLVTFDVIGMEEIYLQINKMSTVLVLHCVDLKISKAEWQGEGGRESVQTPKEIKYNEEEELVILSFDNALNVGRGYLTLNFHTKLGDNMTGFYRTRVSDAHGQDIYNAVTQFEPVLARSSFLCYDEPALKATFDIVLVVPKNKIALSNMPVKSESAYTCGPNASNLVAVSYERTPIMSTYLVAFVVGEFDFIESYTTDGKVRCRVYTPVGRKEQGRFALEMCTKLLPFFNTYFGIDYPISKIDLVACSDFNAGAMENYGLVIFREATLLLDPEITTPFNKQEIALVVSHELSHMWFGNLVTMEWWDGLFLKEGYATFMETMASDYLFPEFDLWTQFVTDCLICAMQMDALQSSHPINVPVNDPVEIDSIFDDISYKKGGSVIRMVQHYIGEEAFKKGMAIYLSRHQYKNTIAADLWRALEETSGKPISEMMPTWTQQMGFPILAVEARQEGNNKILTLRQKKFNYRNSPNIPKSKYESKDYNWFIPLTFCKENDPLTVIEGELMTTEILTVTIPNIDENQWVKLNPGFVGYYLVHYTPEMLSQFIPSIKSKSMAPLDRLNLLNDVFTIAKAGGISTSEVLKFLEAYQNEDNYTVWFHIDQIMANLYRLLLSSDEIFTQYKTYGLKLYSSIAGKLGWIVQENESHLETLLRPLILSRLVSFGDPETINVCVAKFKAFINENAFIAPDLKSLVFKAALSVGDQQTYDIVIQHYITAEMSEEKEEIVSALAGTKDTDILQQALNFAVSDSVRSQDSVYIMKRLISSGPTGRDLVWDYFKKNWKLFKERYRERTVDQLLLFIADSFVSEDKADEIRTFFKTNKLSMASEIIDEAVEKTLLNHGWLERDKADIAGFLSKY